MSRFLLFLIVTLIASFSTAAQELVGFLTNPSGGSVALAHIYYAGRSDGAISDQQGIFRLPKRSDTLFITHVAYQTVQIMPYEDTVYLALEDKVYEPLMLREGAPSTSDLVKKIFDHTFPLPVRPEQLLGYDEVNYQDDVLHKAINQQVWADHAQRPNYTLRLSELKEYDGGYFNEVWANLSFSSSAESGITETLLYEIPAFFDFKRTGYEYLGETSEEGLISYFSKDATGLITFDLTDWKLLSYTINTKEPDKQLKPALKVMARSIAKVKLEMKEAFHYHRIGYDEGRLYPAFLLTKLSFQGTQKDSVSTNVFYRVLYDLGNESPSDMSCLF